MTPSALFPHSWRKPGWILFIPGVILSAIYLFHEFEWSWLEFQIPRFGVASNDLILGDKDAEASSFRKENFTNELIALILLFGSLMVAFSREKIEDEYLTRLRLNALIWAVFVNAIITVLAILFLYSFTFLSFMMTNLFSVLLLFIARYHWLLHKSKAQPDEE